MAVPVHHDEPVVARGVTGDREVPTVDGVVVEGAEADLVADVGGATLGPVLEVVDLDEPGGGTAWEPTAAVAVLDQPA